MAELDRPSAAHRLSGRALAALAALVFALQFARSMNRELDPDEHQFVAPPALLVQEGLLPYVDYPYFHMPTLVYLYAALTGWASYKLLAARAVSAACGTATVLLLFLAGWRLFRGAPPRRRWLLAGGMALVFACSRMFTYTSGWAWNHDTAVLCTLAAFLLHLRGLGRARTRYFAAAGFLLGLAVGIRLSFALSVIPFAVVLCLGQSPLTCRLRLAGLALMSLAAGAALLPALVPLLTAPDRFFFGNLGYPRLSTRFYTEYEPRTLTLPGKVACELQQFLTDPGNALLLLAFLYALLWRSWRLGAWRSEYRNHLLLAVGLLAALWVGVLGPTPLQIQYSYMLVPFMALVVLYTWALERSDPRRFGRLVRAVGVCVAVVAGTGLPRWYWGVVYLPVPSRWTTVALHERGRWVQEAAPAGARVLTIEPAVALEAGLRVYPEYAVGRFVLLVGPLQPPAERRRYGMVSADEVPALLAARPPDAVLGRSQNIPPVFSRYAEGHGYRRVQSPDGQYLMWVRPSVPGQRAKSRRADPSES
jgi:4-amino-4-deoxy-L-arabinose transferase-like glycosyltransferase